VKTNNLELKSATLCVLALLAGLCVVSLTGCATTTEAKVHTGSKTYAGAVGVGVRMEDSVKN
jgi:uncharacterized lipoprotein YehR (DUF1307 family)